MKYSECHGKTFAAILDANRGVGQGFDLLRLALASLILFSHCSGIVGTMGTLTGLMNWLLGIDSQSAATIARATTAQIANAATGGDGVHRLTGLGRPITMSYLPMFFALSGFLVTGSALRTAKLVPFLGLRVLRLLPALFVEVTLSAIILGALFTTLPLGRYFTEPMFWHYFWNIAGHVQFLLPGVFGQNRSPVVNANLWTLPWELYCYVAMAAIIISGMLANRRVFTTGYAIATVLLIYASLVHGFQVVPAHLRGPVLIYYFVTGVVVFLWRDKIVFNAFYCLAAAVVCYGLMMSARTVFLYPLLLTYIMAFIGLFPVPQFKLLRSGDYSYGIYLYGFPVTQALMASWPGFKGNLPLMMVCSFTLTFAFAALSWHGIEKHFLKLKRYIVPKSGTMLHPAAVK